MGVKLRRVLVPAFLFAAVGFTGLLIEILLRFPQPSQYASLAGALLVALWVVLVYFFAREWSKIETGHP